ncbi:hypothetical protein AtNW77_Chr4g0275571 [Arabidopsis thaliana]|uniref:Uncharacterized protein n=4 Tax=Arabidopsis TaxID=3701 RepID=A0A178V115_ARATH|nr:plant/protein [Arabidopsis thaliana]KAG7614978.1 hypothetical protein ISN45_At04g003730 [Arabidopsis thaliana x Arabidopsis arenosa]KAG7619472.1 hypothetical protein ISN44_As04g003610 [Arabidopsis suecica]AAL16235.1 AT4g03150/F4C21_7 [Arabidopsis thaliana]AAM78056.1 AT4g03150/F4C21_7 [Arabidopsis thaliana]AEE82279.1 plant/protein [Arabidopsis thaliana]|eukprot:NP_567252.1 plant/protein [Arabidopsis thaliana]
MSSWVCSSVTRNVVKSHPLSLTKHLDFPATIRRRSVSFPATIRRRSVSFPITSAPKFPSLKLQKSQSSIHEGEEDSESAVQALTIPEEWLLPSRAIEESEWLRVTLHKWLDDEYCPEPTNVEISEVAAKSYYSSLLEKESDMGEILLKMAQDLTSISYQESFHGAFTSANAAINLIVDRIETGLV